MCLLRLISLNLMYFMSSLFMLMLLAFNVVVQVRDIEQTVMQAVKQLDPGASCVVCGSYRRGQPSCGDVDVLIYPDDGRENVRDDVMLHDGRRKCLCT